MYQQIVVIYVFVPLQLKGLSRSYGIVGFTNLVC